METVDNFLAGGRGWGYNDYTDMEYLKTSKIIKNGTSLAVVVPKNILTALRWERGDQIAFGVLDTNSIVIRKLTQEEIFRINNASAGATASI